MLILGGIVLIILGVLMFCFPDVVYSITELWKSDYSGEPSDAYKVHIRIKSVVILFSGIVLLVANFLLP